MLCTPVMLTLRPAVITSLFALASLMAKVYAWSFIAWAVRKSLPLLDAEAANEKIVDLTVELMAKQAELDALRLMREGKV